MESTWILKSKRKCKIVILVDMILSGLALIIVFLFVVGMTLHLGKMSTVLDLLEKSILPEGELTIYFVRTIVLSHLVVFALVLLAGLNVLFRASSLPSNVTDWKEIDAGCRACRLFCHLETFRMILIVITFMGELSVFNLSIFLELIRNVFNLPVLFGWFLTNELQKELETRREQVANTNYLYIIDTSFPAECHQYQSQYQHNSQNRQNLSESNSRFYNNAGHHDLQLPRGEHLGMFMNTSPAVAYFLSSSNAIR